MDFVTHIKLHKIIFSAISDEEKKNTRSFFDLGSWIITEFGLAWSDYL